MNRSAKWSISVVIAFAVALAALALSRFGSGTGTPTAPPSLLLIVVDTLRADHLGLYGYDRQISANLDRFATAAVVYEDAITPAPFTMPAMAALFTGLYPDRTGVTNHSPRHGLGRATATTLAELTGAAGYRTAAVVSNPWLSNRSMGFDRGFESYLVRGPDGERSRDFSAALIAEAALGLLADMGEDPFFLWIHMLDPHMPYQPPAAAAARMGNPSASSAVVRDFVSEARNKQDIYFSGDYPPAEIAATRALYDAEILHVDEQVGRILAALDESGRGNDTIVVFAADHGESLGDHGLYFAHDFTLYDELLHVPLVVRVPGVAPARIGGEVSLIDVLPSLCEWMRLSCAEPMDGRLLPLSPLQGEEVRTVFAASVPYRKRYDRAPRLSLPGPDGRWTMARSNGLKVIRIPRPQGPLWEAYDTDRDPGEATDIASREDLMAMRPALTSWMAQMKASRPPETAAPPPLGKATRERLRALGYLR